MIAEHSSKIIKTDLFLLLAVGKRKKKKTQHTMLSLYSTVESQQGKVISNHLPHYPSKISSNSGEEKNQLSAAAGGKAAHSLTHCPAFHYQRLSNKYMPST